MSLTDSKNSGTELLQSGGSAISARDLRSEAVKVTADHVEIGAVYIAESTCLPNALKFHSEPCSDGWRAVKYLNGYELDRQIRETGWTFFSLGQIKASVFGFHRVKAVRKALNRLLSNVKSDKLNSLEVSQVATKHFVGLHYVTVSANVRHIQESIFLMHDKILAERNQAKLEYSRADRGG